MCVCVQVEGEAEREFWRQQQSRAGGSWIPHTLALSLSEDGQVTVEDRAGEEVTDSSSEQPHLQQGVVYELSMVVAHVRESWMEVPGNLVAHIRVPPFYHQRKKVL